MTTAKFMDFINSNVIESVCNGDTVHYEDTKLRGYYTVEDVLNLYNESKTE